MMIPSGLSFVPSDVETPAMVAALPSGDRAEAVWQNVVGGLTFRLPGIHAKWQRGAGQDLEREAERLRWAGSFVTVPRVVSFERAGGEQLLVTESIPGTSAVLKPWDEHPRESAHALGAGLRAFHDALPVADCPWTWRIADRLSDIDDPTVRDRLAAADPGISRLVVCHGDACAPNTLLGPDGTATGHVDLGDLGVGDLWADLAVLAMSVTWNYGDGHEDEVYAGYGIEPDPGRIAFYRDLWNAG